MMFKPVPITADYLDGYKPIVGMDFVVRRPPRFVVRHQFPMWDRSSSITMRVVSIEPLMAQPIKLTRSWQNVVSGEFMMRERALRHA